MDVISVLKKMKLEAEYLKSMRYTIYYLDMGKLVYCISRSIFSRSVTDNYCEDGSNPGIKLPGPAWVGKALEFGLRTGNIPHYREFFPL